MVAMSGPDPGLRAARAHYRRGQSRPVAPALAAALGEKGGAGGKTSNVDSQAARASAKDHAYRSRSPGGDGNVAIVDHPRARDRQQQSPRGIQQANHDSRQRGATHARAGNSDEQTSPNSQDASIEGDGGRDCIEEDDDSADYDDRHNDDYDSKRDKNSHDDDEYDHTTTTTTGSDSDDSDSSGLNDHDSRVPYEDGDDWTGAQTLLLSRARADATREQRRAAHALIDALAALRSAMHVAWLEGRLVAPAAVAQVEACARAFLRLGCCCAWEPATAPLGASLQALVAQLSIDRPQEPTPCFVALLDALVAAVRLIVATDDDTFAVDHRNETMASDVDGRLARQSDRRPQTNEHGATRENAATAMTALDTGLVTARADDTAVEDEGGSGLPEASSVLIDTLWTSGSQRAQGEKGDFDDQSNAPENHEECGAGRTSPEPQPPMILELKNGATGGSAKVEGEAG
jgi:hypothetical protein